MYDNIQLIDSSISANALRAILDRGEAAYIQNLGNGFTVFQNPNDASPGNLYKVTGPEKRSAGVISTWPVALLDETPNDPSSNERILLRRPGLVHAPSLVPVDQPARLVLTVPPSLEVFQRLHWRFRITPGPHPVGVGGTANWNLCWMQMGEVWKHNVPCYLIYLPHRGILRLTTNYGHPTGGAIHRDKRGVVLKEGHPYWVEGEYVASSHVEVVITDAATGHEVARVREERRIADQLVGHAGLRAAFGHERAEKDARLQVGRGYLWHDLKITATSMPGSFSIHELALAAG